MKMMMVLVTQIFLIVTEKVCKMKVGLIRGVTDLFILDLMSLSAINAILHIANLLYTYYLCLH